MAFVDAIDLASEAGAADAIGSVAGDLARVAPASEATTAGTTSAIRGIAASKSGSTLAAGDVAASGLAIPQILAPFVNPLYNFVFIGGVVVLGIFLNDQNLNALTIITIMGAIIIGVWFFSQRIFPNLTKATATAATATGK